MCFRTGPVRQEGAHNSRKVAAPAHSLPVALLFRSPCGSFTFPAHRFVRRPPAEAQHWPRGGSEPVAADTRKQGDMLLP
jgi:hypothetical protein